MKLTFKSVGEILEEGRIFDEEFAKNNYIEDGVLIIKINETATYEIGLERVPSYKRLLDWTRQLGEKNWMTKDRLLGIMELLSKACNLPF